MAIDVAALITAIDRYMLPPFIAAVVVLAWSKGRRLPALPDATDSEAVRLARLDRERTVRRVGLLNYGLQRGSGDQFAGVPDVLASKSFRSPTTVLDFAPSLFVVLANVPIALGLRRLRPSARWAEILWNLLLTAQAVLVVSWIWRYRCDHRVRRLAANRDHEGVTRFPSGRDAPARTRQGRLCGAPGVDRRDPRVTPCAVRRSLTSALVVGFLALVISVIVLDALDWAIRVRPEINEAVGATS